MDKYPLPMRYLIYSQGVLYASLLVCLMLAPQALGANGGLSYFGDHVRTFLPFGAGLLVSAYFIYLSVEHIRTDGLRSALRAIAICMAGIVLVPAVGTGWLDKGHRLFGSILFITQLGVAVWIVMDSKKIYLNGVLLLLQITGGVIALIYLNPAQGYSLQGQLLFQAAFSVLFLRSMDGYFKNHKA